MLTSAEENTENAQNILALQGCEGKEMKKKQRYGRSRKASLEQFTAFVASPMFFSE